MTNIIYNTCLLIVFVFLFIVVFYMFYKLLNERFEEYFGSSCTDFIAYQELEVRPIKKGQIFVSIASYRDHECNRTVDTIYNNAARPENIFLGICEQNSDDPTEKCDLDTATSSPSIKNKYRDNITYYNLPYTQASGPTTARYYCSKLWTGQEYYLQIDSHIFFEKNWDTTLIDMLEKCRYSQTNKEGSKRPVLSVYPPTDEQLSLNMKPIMDSGRIAENGLPVFLASIASSDKFDNGFGSSGSKNGGPIRSPKPFAAAGYMFLDSTFLYDVPFDPVLAGLFQGEELLTSIRLFTNGYDFFVPNINICNHHYARAGPDTPMFFTDLPKKNECRSSAEKRALFILNLIPSTGVLDEYLRDNHNYGLGSFRTTEDYWNAAGITVETLTKAPISETIIEDKENKEVIDISITEKVRPYKKLISLENWSSGNVSAQFIGWNFNISGYQKIKQYI